MKILIVITIFLFLIVGGYIYLSGNHFFCGAEKKEKEAKALPKYPNAQRYVIDANCGVPDGKPSAYIRFLTVDDKSKVESFYSGHYVNYDDRKNLDQFKWWNVEIAF